MALQSAKKDILDLTENKEELEVAQLDLHQNCPCKYK